MNVPVKNSITAVIIVKAEILFKPNGKSQPKGWDTKDEIEIFLYKSTYVRMRFPKMAEILFLRLFWDLTHFDGKWTKLQNRMRFVKTAVINVSNITTFSQILISQPTHPLSLIFLRSITKTDLKHSNSNPKPLINYLWADTWTWHILILILCDGGHSLGPSAMLSPTSCSPERIVQLNSVTKLIKFTCDRL